MKNTIIVLVVLSLGIGNYDFAFAQQTIKKQLEESREKINLLEELMHVKEDSIRSLQSLLNTSKKSNIDLRQKIENLYTKFNQQEQELKGLREKLDKEEKSNQSSKDLAKQLTRKEAKIINQQSKIAKLEEGEDELNEKLDSIESKNKSLEKEKKWLEDEKIKSAARERQLNRRIESLQSVISELTPLKQKILEDIRRDMNRLYQSKPEQSEPLIKNLERQFAIALSFENIDDIKELKKKFDVYQSDRNTIIRAQETLSKQYKPVENKQALGQLAQVSVPVFQQEKNRLIGLLSTYCQANNEIYDHFVVLHSYGSEKLRASLLSGYLRDKISFRLEDYAFLQGVVSDKQNQISENTMPRGIKEENCNN